MRKIKVQRLNSKRPYGVNDRKLWSVKVGAFSLFSLVFVCAPLYPGVPLGSDVDSGYTQCMEPHGFSTTLDVYGL